MQPLETTGTHVTSVVGMQQKARQGTSPREGGGQTHVTNSYLPLVSALSVFPYFTYPVCYQED